MKRFIGIVTLAVLAAAACASASGQARKLENNIQLCGGLFLESGCRADQNPGVMLGLSYGLDIRLNDRWSVMPGAGIRSQGNDASHWNWLGNDPDFIDQADLFVLAGYHLADGKTGIVLRAGPVFSYTVSGDTYYIDAQPELTLNGRDKFRNFDVGIRPGISFLYGKHFQWGLEANFGLLNVMRQYSGYDGKGEGSARLCNIAVTCGLRF